MWLMLVVVGFIALMGAPVQIAGKARTDFESLVCGRHRAPHGDVQVVRHNLQ